MNTKNDREKEILEPRPFGVEYVPHSRRMKSKPGEPVCVAKVSEIPPGKAKAVDFHNFKLAVFNIDGTFYAVKDACPHAQYPLSNGKLAGTIVTCSSHSWKFDVRNGACLKADKENPETKDLSIRSFAVEVIGDEIWIRP